MSSAYAVLLTLAGRAGGVALGGVALAYADLVGLVDAEAQALLDEGWRPYDVTAVPVAELTDLVRGLAGLTIGLTFDAGAQPGRPAGGRYPLLLVEARCAYTGAIRHTPRGPARVGEDLWALADIADHLPGELGRLVRQLDRAAAGDDLVLPGRALPPRVAGSPAAPPGCTRVRVDSFELDCCGEPFALGDLQTYPVKEWEGGLVAEKHLGAPRSVSGVVRAIHDIDGDGSTARPLSFWPHRACLGSLLVDLEATA